MSLEALRFSVEEGAGTLPPAERARLAHRRLDAAGGGPCACAPGCAACCHLLVEVSASEARLLAARVDELPGVRERVAANARRATGLPAAAYRRARIRCALLGADDRCLVYADRPLACRAHASRDRSACERAFRGELGLNDLPLDPWRASAAAAVRAGLGEETRELHAALLREAPCAGA